ncbi:M4 family metallopeptidase [Rubrivirga sp.]|uniref:M4 family metallopeptidase n=1 Tax=Rubrivirga sp. TaxID=1885344 RepID=UPI003B52ECDE
MTFAPLRRATALAVFVLALAPMASAQSGQSDQLSSFASVDRVSWHEDRDVPLFLAGDLGAATSADAFFRAHAGAFGFEDAPDVVVTETTTDQLGLTHVRVQQTVGGVPVWGAESALHVRRGQAYAWGGDLHPGAVGVSTRPALDASASIQAAQRALGSVEYRRSVGDAPLSGQAEVDEWAPQVGLVVFPHDEGYRLAYHVRLFVDAPTPANWEVFVDAATGEVIHRFNSLHTFDPRAEAASGVPYARTPDTSVLFAGPTNGTGTSTFGGTLAIPTFLSGSSYYLYDTTRGPQYIRTMTANNGTGLPGSYITDSDNNFTATAARAGVDAHFGAVATFDYYKNTHGRNSYNGNNASITSTVHYSSNYNNAFWNGSQMVYGDGDGTTFAPLVELDIVAHELTHAVTSSTAGLIYQNESGALNESMSDIFAIMVDRNDYTVGELSYTPGVPGDALRSLSNPPAGNQPDNYADRYIGSQDNGGVHINSGISNKAAYLLSAGGTFRGVTVASIGRAKVEKIFYRALTTYFTQSTNFAGARQGTLQATADLYGSGSSTYTAVQNAWAAVGVGTTGGGGGGTPQWRYETANLQTPHNYPNNYNNTKTYSKPGAQRVAMYFEQFDLETNYDYVYIKDASGATKATYTGNRAAFWAIVDGTTIRANIVTDASVTRYGYRVTQVAYFSDQALLGGELVEPRGGGVEAVGDVASDVLAVRPAKAEAEVAELALAVGPNPAGATTTATVSLPHAGDVRVVVLDLLGREVAAPHAGALDAGRTPIQIDTSALPSGVYVVVLDADGQRLTRQVTVVR